MKITKSISIGCRCSISSVMNCTKLRKESFPFDWTVTCDLNYVINAINNKLEDFYTENYNKINKYNIFMPHLIFGDENRIVVNRRCNRFLNYLNSDEKILFIRLSHDLECHYVSRTQLYKNYNDLEESIKFKKMIENNYPNLSFHVLFINCCHCTNVADFVDNDTVILRETLDDYIFENKKITVLDALPEDIIDLVNNHIYNKESIIDLINETNCNLTNVTDHDKKNIIFASLSPIFNTYKKKYMTT